MCVEEKKQRGKKKGKIKEKEIRYVCVEDKKRGKKKEKKNDIAIFSQ